MPNISPLHTVCPTGSEINALAGVSLEIALGEQLAIVGPNGSGKSTLGLCLANLITPTSGEVGVRASSASDAPDPANTEPHAAIVFQTPDDNLVAETVSEEISLALEHCVGDDARGASVVELLDEFGVGHLADRRLDRLSGGEKQIVAVVCAFASGRQLIVLDEPTSHLDPPGRRHFFEFLDSLTGSNVSSEFTGRSVVLVTQYPEEARRFARVIELAEGDVVYDGSSSDWKSAEPSETLPEIDAAVPENAPVILRVEDLTQVATPDWPLPEYPLREISLRVRTGEMIGLCGPIGAGKTTLAYHVAGLIDRYVGEITFPGSGSEEPLYPALMIQFPERQLFCATVAEDVAAGLRDTGLTADRQRERADRVLSELGLPPERFAGRSPFGLSGGQKRRAAMAGIAILKRPLFILDEPTAALDQDGLERLTDLCRRWQAEGISHILISHDLPILQRLTKRAWVLDRGRLVFDGSWGELKNHPEITGPIGF